MQVHYLLLLNSARSQSDVGVLVVPVTILILVLLPYDGVVLEELVV